MFFWLAEDLPFLKAISYAVGTLSMNSPYNNDITFSTIGVIFNIIYIFIGVGVYLIFVLEAGKTIITAHEKFERKQEEKKALKKEKKNPNATKYLVQEAVI